MATLFITLWRFLRAVWQGLKDPEFKALLTITVVILLSGMFFYHGVEKWSWLDSLYFSVTTLTTVGLGDFSPHTSLGKIFTIVYIFIGIGVIFGFINAVAHHAQKNTQENFKKAAERRDTRKTATEKENEPHEPDDL